MVSFWPWGKDNSPASFEKALSALSAKIATTQTQLDQTRSRSRRVKLLCTLYLGFAYLVYAIVLMLVVGWKKMGPFEWSGMAGGPVLISVARSATTTFFDYRIQSLSARLKDQQTERAKTIQKLKEATKYDSTLELLEKYGGSESRNKKGEGKAEEDEGGRPGEKGNQTRGKRASLPQRTNMPPPPTANIQWGPASSPGPPQPRPQSARGTPSHPQPVQPDMDVSAEFAPNAFDGKNPPPSMHYPPAVMTPSAESHWYDRILDTLLGEDETAAKNRIVLICSACRLVNGQAPPGTKTLSELGMWKCMACGAVNGEMDEGKRIVQEVLGEHSAGVKTETTDEDAGRSSSDLVEVDKDSQLSDADPHSSGAEGSGKQKGKKKQ